MAIAATFPAAGTRTSRPRPARVRPARGRQAAPAIGMRLTARGRVVLLVASATFLFLAIVLSGRLTADAGTAAASGPVTRVVVVQAGESLWQIAQEIAPLADPRETVTLLRELNGLQSGTVAAGQAIVVPSAPR